MSCDHNLLLNRRIATWNLFVKYIHVPAILDAKSPQSPWIEEQVFSFRNRSIGCPLNSNLSALEIKFLASHDNEILSRKFFNYRVIVMFKLTIYVYWGIKPSSHSWRKSNLAHSSYDERLRGKSARFFAFQIIHSGQRKLVSIASLFSGFPFFRWVKISFKCWNIYSEL